MCASYDKASLALAVCKRQMKNGCCIMSSSASTSSQKAPDVCSILLNKDYAKSVLVPEAKQHQDGYTVYKILLQAIRVKKTIEDDPLIYVAWKRFRDLHKLHRRICIVHAQLYLKGVVPPFPKPDFFGRLEPSVVEERRLASQDFLSFVVQNPVLCQCEALLVFFSGAECQKAVEKSVTVDFEANIPSSSPQPAPLSPLLADCPPRIQLGKLQEAGRSLSESSDMSDELSLYSPTDSKVVQRNNAGGSNDLLAVFDPFPSSSSGLGVSNYQMLAEAMSDLQVSVSESSTEQSSRTIDNSQSDEGISSTRDLSPSFATESRMIRSSLGIDGTRKEAKANSNHVPRWRSKIADFFPKMSPSSSKHGLDSNHSPSPSSDMKTVKSETQLSKSTGLFRSKGKTRRGGSPGAPTGITRSSSLDYVLQAAEFISSAQKAEEESAFDLAFTCYKSAVMLLLQGVQDEKDLNRRNAVRLKTAKYLKKAEKLYTTYIASDTNSAYCLDGFTSRFLSNFGVMGFQSLHSELAHYKVLRILGRKVQLVQDVVSGEKYVIKCLDKSCYSGAYSATRILDQCVPTRVPHMVKLVKFWDTDTMVIVLLEYAPGGLLWRRLRPYFEKVRRLFRRYFEKCASGDDKERRSFRRSGSLDNRPATIKQRGSVGYRHRSGSDPVGRQSKDERHFSVTSETFEDDEHEEMVQAGRLCGNDKDTSLFAMYEQQSMVLRRSTEDSFSLDTAPPSAAPTTTRKFSLLYAEHHVASETSSEVEEALLRKWIAQITVALGYLHGEGVLCRDLHPENLLLDSQDNVLLTFFCDWTGVDRPFNHRLYTKLYCAPEADGTVNEPLTDAADWWSLGVILYEIATGMPLHSQCPHAIGPNTVIPLPDYLSVELRDLITRLVRYDAEDRLGACFGGVDEIKMHPFFMEFDWHTVEPS